MYNRVLTDISKVGRMPWLIIITMHNDDAQTTVLPFKGWLSIGCSSPCCQSKISPSKYIDIFKT